MSTGYKSSATSNFFYISDKKQIDCNGTQTHNHLLWLHVWVFVYELSDCGFQSRSSYLYFRYCTCFEQGVPWHWGSYRVYIHFKCACNIIKTQKSRLLPYFSFFILYTMHNAWKSCLQFQIRTESWFSSDGSFIYCSMYPKVSQKLTFPTPWYTLTCAYQGVRSFSFSESFAYVLNLWSLMKYFVGVFSWPIFSLRHSPVSCSGWIQISGIVNGFC